MANIGNIDEQVKELLSKLVDVLKEVSVVRVKTLETEFEIKNDNTKDPPELEIRPKAGDTSTYLVTEINMIQGDISEMRTPNLRKSDTAALKTVHEEHVRLAQEIFRGNLEYLAKAVGLSES